MVDVRISCIAYRTLPWTKSRKKLHIYQLWACVGVVFRVGCEMQQKGGIPTQHGMKPALMLWCVSNTGVALMVLSACQLKVMGGVVYWIEFEFGRQVGFFLCAWKTVFCTNAGEKKGRQNFLEKNLRATLRKNTGKNWQCAQEKLNGRAGSS